MGIMALMEEQSDIWSKGLVKSHIKEHLRSRHPDQDHADAFLDMTVRMMGIK
jgi:hypothetical protein